jgi:hypothetical protein
MRGNLVWDIGAVVRPVIQKRWSLKRGTTVITAQMSMQHVG